MDITDRGYRFHTIHNDHGSTARVIGAFQRLQSQAPIRRNQDFELEFYGRGAGIQLFAATLARYAEPATMAAERRELITNALADVRAASDTLAALAPSSGPSSSPTPGQPSVVVRTVLPDFQSPFDERWIDWGMEPPTFPPIDPIPPGGGGGALLHSAVRIKLFTYGGTVPIATWELPEGYGDTMRSVVYAPEGFPGPDSPVRRTGWWRMVVTPIGPDPVEIRIAAQTRVGDVPITITPLSVRLTDHLFRVGLDALVPNAVIEGDELRLSLGTEVADIIGTGPLLSRHDIGPITGFSRLRSLDITSITGAELKTRARAHYAERAARYPFPSNPNATLDYKIDHIFSKQIERLAQVQPDDVCLRIQAGFSDATFSVYGFDVATLDGEAGEIYLAFDRNIHRMRPFSFLDVELTTLGSIFAPIVALFKEVPSDVNKYIEDHLIGTKSEEAVVKYMREFLKRAVGQHNEVYDFRLSGNAWQIRNSADPIIPLPRVTHPPVTGDPFEGGGIVNMLARADAALGGEPSAPQAEPDIAGTISAVPGAVPTSDETSEDTPGPSNMPPGFMTVRDNLGRLDAHSSIVVIMMENRSYDHLLGDLMNARPGPKPDFPYDGAPNTATNPGVGGFHEVPLVHTRDLRLGTAIPVSPRHSFNPVQFQIGDGTEAGRGSGDMAGFARDLYHKSDSPQLAMTVYGAAELPVHYKLADDFVTCDRWFAAHPGPTFPNRFATIMGSIPELDNFENEDPRLGYLKYRTIFDVLTHDGIDWRVFESDLSLIRMFDKYRIDDKRVLPIYDKDVGFEATLKKPGPLPRVMFVEPNFADIPPVKTADDDHPPADLANGQRFLSHMCNLIWDNNRFDEVLLVITYDEHGGFYDHVPPPGTPKGEPGVFAPLIAGGPTYLGVRVPTFVVSPFISSGRADRTIFDHTSILKTILVHNRDRLSHGVLTSFGQRVNEANDLSVLLDLPFQRQKPVAFPRPNQSKSRPVSNAHGGPRALFDAAGHPMSPTAPAVSGITPREVVVSQRTTPLPDESPEKPREYHAALAKMLKPRKPGSQP